MRDEIFVIVLMIASSLLLLSSLSLAQDSYSDAKVPIHLRTPSMGTASKIVLIWKNIIPMNKIAKLMIAAKLMIKTAQV
jgi:hypothetical protein